MRRNQGSSYGLLEESNDRMATNKKFIDFRNFKYHWIDTLLAIALWLIGAIVQFAGTPFHRYFSERDPSLSYPYITRVDIPTGLLFFLCWLVPAAIIAISQFALLRRFGDKSRKHKVAKFFLAQMVLFQALGITLFLTSLSKVFFGRQRPNFFAFCDYKGYRTAVETGNYTEYFSLTTPNAPGDISFCRASQADINESMFSHPSGHSSLSFAGLGFLSLFLHHMLLSHRPTRRHHLWKGIVFAVPMFIAVIVAATRTRDYWHNYDDTIMGGLLGFGCASLAFKINYSNKTPHKVEYVGDLFPEGMVELEQEDSLPLYPNEQDEDNNYVAPSAV